MGLLNFLSKFKNGNFSLVAHNVTEIYAVLKYRYPNSFPNKHIMAATAGIINGAQYLQAGKLNYKHILSLAEHYDPSDIGGSDYHQDIEVLVSFIRGYEEIIFVIDNPKLSVEIIIDSVEGKIEVIRDSVVKTLSKAKKDKNFKSSWRNPTINFMNMSEFREVREEIGIISNKQRSANIASTKVTFEISSDVINKIRTLITHIAKLYTKGLYKYLNPSSYEPVFIEVIAYLIYHLDNYQELSDVNESLRHEITSRSYRRISAYYYIKNGGHIIDKIESKLELYKIVSSAMKKNHKESFNAVHLIFYRSLNSMKMPLKTSSTLEGDEDLDLNSELLVHLIPELDKKYITQVYEQLEDILSKCIFSTSNSV